jgi:hypothetical protein
VDDEAGTGLTPWIFDDDNDYYRISYMTTHVKHFSGNITGMLSTDNTVLSSITAIH